MCLPKSICVLRSHVISTPYTIVHITKKQCNVTETSIGDQCPTTQWGRRGRRGSWRRLAHPVTSPTMVTSTTIGRGICFLQLCNTTKYWTQECIKRVIMPWIDSLEQIQGYKNSNSNGSSIEALNITGGLFNPRNVYQGSIKVLRIKMCISKIKVVIELIWHGILTRCPWGCKLPFSKDDHSWLE